MLERILQLAIAQRWLVLLLTLAMAALGLFSYQKLAIDAVPDITNVQVQINTKAPGYSPLETEQRATFAIETAMAGMPKLKQVRSLSRYGLSQVTVVFEDGTDIYFARQMVNERLQSAKESLPQGVVPEMGPISTGWEKYCSGRWKPSQVHTSPMAQLIAWPIYAKSRTGSSVRNYARFLA